MKINHLPFLSLLFINHVKSRYTHTFPPTLYNGPISASYYTPSIYTADLDAPRLSQANRTSFEWWRFEAFSAENADVSVAVTFSLAGPGGYPLPLPIQDPQRESNLDKDWKDERGDDGHALWTHLSASLPSGKTIHHTQPVPKASMNGSGDAVFAEWDGAGWFVSDAQGIGFDLRIDLNSPGTETGTGTGTEAGAGDGTAVEDGVVVNGGIKFERVFPRSSPSYLFFLLV